MFEQNTLNALCVTLSILQPFATESNLTFRSGLLTLYFSVSRQRIQVSRNGTLLWRAGRTSDLDFTTTRTPVRPICIRIVEQSLMLAIILGFCLANGERARQLYGCHQCMRSPIRPTGGYRATTHALGAQ